MFFKKNDVTGVEKSWKIPTGFLQGSKRIQFDKVVNTIKSYLFWNWAQF